MTTKTCKCGAEILFAVNRKTGRTVPLNARPEVVYEMDPENRNDSAEPRVRGRTAYLSHFLTCPFASEFSKRRMGGR